MQSLEAYRPFMEKCSHCAFCQATCPSFGADISESQMPRARMEIIRACLLDKSMPLTRRARQIIARCLLCGNCNRTCPAAIPVEEMSALARAEIGGLNPFTRSVTRRFARNRGLSGIWRVAANAGRGMGLAPREVPPIAAAPFAPGALSFPAAGEERARILYFVGCAANSLCPETARDVVSALTRNGIAVAVPDGIVCCGAPLYSAGDLEKARENARVNVEALSIEGFDAVVTECTTCASFLKEKTIKLLGPEDPLAEKAKALSARVYEATDYLLGKGLSAEPDPAPRAVTFHVPCHRGFSPTVDEAPRRLLEKVPGLTIRDMERPDACCGAGGLFFAKNRAVSGEIRRRKLSDIEASGAECVVTPCPMCRAFISGADRRIETVHPLSLVRYGKEEP